MRLLEWLKSNTLTTPDAGKVWKNEEKHEARHHQRESA